MAIKNFKKKVKYNQVLPPIILALRELRHRLMSRRIITGLESSFFSSMMQPRVG